MKKCFLFFACAMPFVITAQQTLSHAVIKTRIHTSAESSGMNRPSEMVRVMNQQMGGSTILTEYLKDSVRKTIAAGKLAEKTMIYNQHTGVSTTITELNGTLTGFTQTPKQRAEHLERLDSAIHAKQISPVTIRFIDVVEVVGIKYTDKEKQINNINCKKAVFTTKNQFGNISETDIWYSPDYVLPEGVDILPGSLLNLSMINGLPVKYEYVNKITMGINEVVAVTRYEIKSISTDVAIEDKEFETPSDYQLITSDQYTNEILNPKMMPPRMTFRTTPVRTN